MTMLSKLWSFYYKEFRWKLGLAILLLVAGAMTEGLGLAAILTLFDDNREVNFFGHQANEFYTKHIFSILFLLFLFRGILLWIVSLFSSSLVIILKEKVYNEIVNQTFKASYKSIFNLGDIPISNLLIREVVNISAGLKVYLQMIKSILISAIYFILPTLIIPEISIILLGFAFFIFAIMVPIQNIMKRLSKKLVSANEQYLKRLKSAFASIASIKAGNRSQNVNDDIRSKMENMLTIERTQLVKIEPAVANIIDSFVFFTVLILIALNEEYKFVTDSLFILCLGMIFKSLTTIVGAYGNLRKIATYSGSFEKFLEMKNYLEENSEPKIDTLKLSDFELNEICLANAKIKVSDELILSNINLQLKRGDRIALVGSSGVGKSTLLNCIATLIPIDDGNYSINKKHDAIDVRDKLRSSISLITQNYYFEEDYVKDCFNFEKISHTELHGELVSLDLISEELDYESFLNRKINSLSGGERQRLSIVKEMCTDKTFFLLDEITSAISEGHEHMVIKYIKHKSKDRIVIAVTHSELLARSLDKVIDVEFFKDEQ